MKWKSIYFIVSIGKCNQIEFGVYIQAIAMDNMIGYFYGDNINFIGTVWPNLNFQYKLSHFMYLGEFKRIVFGTNITIVFLSFYPLISWMGAEI